MYFCHPKHSELAEHLQKYKGRVVLRGDNVKDAISRLLGMAEKKPPATECTLPLESNLYGYPLAGLLWERASDVIVQDNGGKK